MSNKRTPKRPILPPRFHHTAITTLRLDAMVGWYEKVAGLTPVYHGDRGAWLTNDEANHRISLLVPDGLVDPTDKPHTTGLHHTAFEYASFDQWLDNYIRLREAGITPFLTLDHGMTMSLYYADPDGNGVEIQVDTFGNWAASKEWMFASIEFATDQLGSHFDPEFLVKAREDGQSFEQIHRRTRNGEFTPAQVPASILLPDAPNRVSTAELL
ncbi:VOC family protein [Paenarthrobacter sp. RAF54_2]|uniref:VOC family protein n=1 Tax=Paenarthrobacter sp. RAF54_2 TaxID=3233061 RepID=UPI003F9B86C7